MKTGFKRFSTIALVTFLMFFNANKVFSCHGVSLLNYSVTYNASGVLIDANSDPATCGCGPYWMQVEIRHNKTLITGAPSAAIQTSLFNGTPVNTYPWYHGLLNIPNYNLASNWFDNCVLEPYTTVFIPYSDLCPGQKYYFSAREWLCGSGIGGPWTSLDSFIAPGVFVPGFATNFSSASTTFCQGASTTFSVTPAPAGVYSYNWIPTTDLSNPNISNPVATFNTAGSIEYIVEVLSSANCLVRDSVTFTINPKPNFTLSATPAAICIGNNATLNTTMGAPGVYTYAWSPPTNLSGTSIANPTVLAPPVGTSVYSLTVTNGFGCVETNSVSVVVNPYPVFTTQFSPATLCAGQNVSLSINQTVGGPLTYSWSPAASLNSATIANPTALALPAGAYSYSVTGTTVAGCATSGSTSFTVNPIPAFTINASPNSFCFGGNSNLTTTMSVPGTYSYLWTPGTNLSSNTVANPTINSPFVGTSVYTLAVTNSFLCSNTHTTSITVNPLPVFTSQITPSNLCEGQSGTLSLNQTSGGTLTYSWSPSGNLSSATVSNPTVSGLSVGNYTYTLAGTTLFGCVSSSPVSFAVNPTPTFTAVLTSAAEICAGKTVSFDAYAPLSSNYSYIWSPATYLNSASIPNPTASNMPAGLYNYIATASNSFGCTLTDTVSFNAKACDIIIYTGVSPNGDGINDSWIIDGAGTSFKVDVIIFNRWGQKVWEKDDYDNLNNVWKGDNNKGGDLVDGTYYYQVKTDANTYKGKVELVR